jgi:hypothetical protein
VWPIIAGLVAAIVGFYARRWIIMGISFARSRSAAREFKLEGWGFDALIRAGSEWARQHRRIPTAAAWRGLAREISRMPPGLAFMIVEGTASPAIIVERASFVANVVADVGKDGPGTGPGPDGGPKQDGA